MKKKHTGRREARWQRTQDKIKYCKKIDKK